MKNVIGAIWFVATLLTAGLAQAQQSAWIQIEAYPTLREAQGRARAYSNAFEQVHGFQMRSGWYAVALGPYDVEQAAQDLRRLVAEGRIPDDSYLADAAQFGQPFWPVGLTAIPTTPGTTTQAATTTPTDTPQPVVIEAIPDETPSQARRSERDLTRAEREKLQEAMKWDGFYTAAIDGAFGPGTRRAMRDYQTSMGYEATGILTTRQRAELLENYAAALAALGMQTIDNTQAGIRISMPLALVKEGRVEPPFVHYDSVSDMQVRALLISQKGDQNTLFGLYDIMQTLEIVPLQGTRERSKNSFILTGQNADLHSYTYAALSDGMVKGFTLLSRPQDTKLAGRAIELMRASFEPYGETALDETLGSGGVQSIDLMAGLEIRRPYLSRSGFYINKAGAVLTTTEVLDQCERITIGDDLEADVAARDDALGLAVLTPRASLAPQAYAAFQSGAPRLKSDVAVAGFSYGDTLDLPIVTYGTLADLRGLSGEATLTRLSLEALPGDAGGPVFDASGAVVGLLLPSASTSTRTLPADVSFASNVSAIGQFLANSGIETTPAEGFGAMDPVDLTALALDMTVLVSCWN